MGSSAATCLVTGLNLSNEPAVFIPLAPSKFTNRKAPTMIGGSKILGDQHVLFSPLTLPIFGRVNDCGEFDTSALVEDANTKRLNKKLGDLPKWLEDITGTETFHHPVIDKYARMVGRTSPRWPGKEWDGTTSGCWVHKGVWDLMSTQSWDRKGIPNNTVFWGGSLCQQTLKGLGFQRGEENQTLANEVLGPGPHAGGRYNIPWTHPELPTDLIFWSSQYSKDAGKASYQGKRIGESYGDFRSVYTAMTSLGLEFPAKSLLWALVTSVFLPSTLDARDLQQLTDEVGEDLAGVYEKNPQFHFRPLSGTLKTTAEGVTQTLCDGRWHVTATARNPGGGSISHTITKCSKGSDPRIEPGSQVVFSSRVWEDLRAVGWKPKKRTRDYDGLNSLGLFPEETFRLYGSKLLVDDLLPLVLALRMFDLNLLKSNRMWTPTRVGLQESYRIQREVATLTARVLYEGKS